MGFNFSLDKDTKAVWERLTEKEKKEFERLTADGELSNLVEIWTPWWNDKVGQTIVVSPILFLNLFDKQK